MTPKKDEYMRGYADGFKDAVAGIEQVAAEKLAAAKSATSNGPVAYRVLAVKPLEWHGEPEWCFADTPVGHYTVCRRTNPSCYRVDSHGRDRMESFDASTGDAARAAAQADFDKRILAWIEGAAALHLTQQPPHAGDGQ